MLITIISFLLAPNFAFAATPEQMLKAADEGRMPAGTYTFVVTVKDYGAGPMRETRYEVSSKSTEGNVFSLVDTVFPERQKGRKLLMRGNDLWLYLPTVKRPTRISFRERLTGEVANGDISRTNFANDYQATDRGAENVGGKKCVHLSLAARNKDVTYSRIEYWIDAKTYAPVKAEFYALSGKLLKTGEYSAAKMILGKPRMSRLLIKDALQPKRQSVLDFGNFRRVELPDSLFNKESLSE